MNEFADIAGFSKYLINRLGIVVLKSTGKQLKRKIEKKNGRVSVALCPDGVSTSHSSVSVFKLLAIAFLNTEKAVSRLYVCVPRDGDHSNVCLDNTIIVSQKAYQTFVAKKRREKGLRMFNWSGNNQLTESPKSGFYWIPFIRFPVAISRSGQIFNFMKGHEIKPTVNHKGYLTVGLWNEDLGKYTVYSVHRLVARVFIDVPKRYSNYDISELQVNHKDGIKENNTEDNLEWCLNHENMLHAREAGLFSNTLAVLAKDVRNNKVTRYKSVSECSRELGIQCSPLLTHLSSKRSAGRITFNWHVVKFDDSSEWPILLMEEYDKDGFKWVCNVMVTDTVNDLRFIFCNYRHACRSLGLTLHSVRNWISRHGHETPYEGFLFRTLTDEMSLE